MGLFKRNTKRTGEAIEIKPVIAESPIVSVDELEQMVRVVFEEKLELERQLEAAKAELDHSKDTNAKLRAAEEFSRQVKRDALDLNTGLSEPRMIATAHGISSYKSNLKMRLFLSRSSSFAQKIFLA